MVQALREWRVVVHRIGDIGCVTESTESLARCAALSKFGEPGERISYKHIRSPVEHDGARIYEDDDFDVKEIK